MAQSEIDLVVFETLKAKCSSNKCMILVLISYESRGIEL
jgi:hypothetical protein